LIGTLFFSAALTLSAVQSDSIAVELALHLPVSDQPPAGSYLLRTDLTWRDHTLSFIRLQRVTLNGEEPFQDTLTSSVPVSSITEDDVLQAILGKPDFMMTVSWSIPRGETVLHRSHSISFRDVRWNAPSADPFVGDPEIVLSLSDRPLEVILPLENPLSFPLHLGITDLVVLLEGTPLTLSDPPEEITVSPGARTLRLQTTFPVKHLGSTFMDCLEAGHLPTIHVTGILSILVHGTTIPLHLESQGRARFSVSSEK